MHVSRTRILILVVVSGLFVALHGCAKSALYAADLIRIWSNRSVAIDQVAVSRIGRAVFPMPMVDDRGQPSTLDLAGQTAVVFYYDRHCQFCHWNMARWLEMLVALRERRIPAYGVALRKAESQSPYWRGLQGTLTLLDFVRDSTVLEEFGTDVTPATIVVKNGVITAVYTGVITHRQQDAMLASLDR